MFNDLRLVGITVCLFIFVSIGIYAQSYPLWTRTYGGSGSDYGFSVQQTSDEGYIITGYSEGDVYLVKTDPSGDTLWTKTYEGVVMAGMFNRLLTGDILLRQRNMLH